MDSMILRGHIGTCLFCIALITLSAQASQLDSGKLKGMVIDPNEARVPHAIITVKNNKRKVKLESDEAGEFEVEVPAGIYEVTVRWPGFVDLSQSNVEITSGVTKELNIQLEVVEHSGPEPPSEPQLIETILEPPGDQIVEKKPKPNE